MLANGPFPACSFLWGASFVAAITAKRFRHCDYNVNLWLHPALNEAVMLDEWSRFVLEELDHRRTPRHGTSLNRWAELEGKSNSMSADLNRRLTYERRQTETRKSLQMWSLATHLIPLVDAFCRWLFPYDR